MKILCGKIWRIMILTCLLMSGFMCISPKCSAQTVKITEQPKTLKMIFGEIERQTGKLTLFSNNELDMNRKVKLEIRDYTLEELYGWILRGLNLEFEILNDYVVIRPARNPVRDSACRMIAVKGVVDDREQTPLPGVTIVIKGTYKGVVSDKDGRFTIFIPEHSDVVLCFSFVGKKTREIKYTGQMTLHVILEEEEYKVDEVVITGYQKIEKRHLTSAVTTLKMDHILLPGTNTLDRMLEGHVPGMIFMQNSGQVGAVPRLRIRGTSTLLGTQEPLWVLDGIVLNDPVNIDPTQVNDLDFVNLLGNAISGLNPNDIEQIDVLKDASATALYGARAANGVIMITTRKGKAGPPTLSYNFSGSLTQRSRYTDRAVNVMNSVERIDYSREILEKGLVHKNMGEWIGYEGAYKEYNEGKISFAEFQQLVNDYEAGNTDWFDVICRDAFSHNHNLSLSGGGTSMKYYISLGYGRENGILRKEYGDRYTTNVRVSVNHNKFDMTFGIMGNVQERYYTPSEVSLMDYAYNTSRAIPVYNKDGSLWSYPKNEGRFVVNYNVLNDRDNSGQTIKGNGFSLMANVGYKLLEALRAEVTLAYTLNSTEQEIYLGEKTAYAADLRGEMYNGSQGPNFLPFGGELRSDYTTNNSYTLRGQINYNKFLDRADNHLLTIAFGGELNSTKYTGKRQVFRGYLPDRGKIISTVTAGKYPDFEKWLLETPEARGILKDQLTNMFSVYGTISYSLYNAFIFNVNMRIDASNKFGGEANKKLLPIWSVSGRWNMKEDVLERVNWINTLSLRTSFGYQGNMLDLETPEMIIEKGEWDNIMEEYKSTIYKFPNPNLSWEKTVSFNTSMDFAFFSNRVQGCVSYFYKKTSEAFLRKKISVINGVREYTINQGTLVNQGFEFTFTLFPIPPDFNAVRNGKRGFTWRIDPQFGKVLNKLVDRVLSKKNGNQSMHDDYTYADYLNGDVQMRDRPLNSFFSYEFIGLDSRDGRPDFAYIGEENWEKYDEMNKEQVFLTVMKYSGCRIPYLQGGIVNTFGYRRFTMSCNFTYSVGSRVRLLKLYNDDYLVPKPAQNLRREFVNRWRRPGDEKRTVIPGLLSDNTYSGTVNTPWWKNESYKFAENIWQMYNDSDIRVVSGDYLRLQHISLRYSFPDEFCEKINLSSFYVSLSATNLFTLSHKDLKGQDPNTQSGSTSNIHVPLRPSYTLNLNVAF